MKSQEKKEIILTLTLDEAAWLKTVVQNPLNATGDPAFERQHDKETRRKFWEELKKYTL